MSHSFFAYIARMRYISRWGLMRNTDPENVQEHSHMVAVLAHALAVIRRDKFGGTIDPGHVAAVALYHDAPEIFTGDLPTPVKYANDTSRPRDPPPPGELHPGPPNPGKGRQRHPPGRLQGRGSQRRGPAHGHAPAGDAACLRRAAVRARPGGPGLGEGR